MQRALETVAVSAEGQGVFIRILDFAGFVLETWL